MYGTDLLKVAKEELEDEKKVYAKAQIKERLKEIEALKKALALEEKGLKKLLNMTVKEIYEESL